MHRSTKQALDQLLLQVVDGSLAGVVFLVPLLMGGRHAIGQLVLTVLAVAAGWAWAAHRCLRNNASWRPTWAAPLLLVGLALVVLQAIPLPPWLLTQLAPHTSEILPLWDAAGSDPAAFGRWPCVSFTPTETLAGLVLFLDFVLLFFVAVHRIRHVEDVERLLRWCALSATCMAAFGIVQLLTSNGKFFWFYEPPFSSTSDAAHGSFTNRNHFANFLALGIGPLIWWLQDASRRRRARRSEANRPTASNTMPRPAVLPHIAIDGRGLPWNNRKELKTYLLGMAMGIVLFAGLLSLSRGGIAVMFLAATICTVLCYWTSSVSGRFVAVLGVVGLLTGASLAIFGFDCVSNRLDDLSSGSLERLDRAAGRRTIWAAAVKAFPDSLPLGTGVGSFREVYPMYLDAALDEDIEFTHAENGYLQVAVETGAIGLASLFAGIALCGAWCIRGVRPSNATRMRVCAAAIAASLAASTAHSLVDFVWYVPACTAMVAILAACALRVAQLGGEGGKNLPPSLAPRPSPLSPLAWMTMMAAATILGVWMIASCVGPAMAQPYWDEYLVARHAPQKQPPSDEDPAMADDTVQQQWIDCLENVVQWQPTHTRAHLALAETHRQLFEKLQIGAENQMSLASIRDAAIQSRFPSRKALVDWLLLAVGKHWIHLEQAVYHTRQAIALTPLQGRGYVYLADLSFLFGADAAVKRACVRQALRVRPFDGAVLYAAAGEALLDGNTAQWLEYLKQAFRCGRLQQQQFIDDMAAATPTENLPGLIDFILGEFQPDLECLRFLHAASAKRCPIESLTPLIQYQAQKAEAEATAVSGREAATLWIEAQRLHDQLGDGVEALRCARNAVQCDPNNYQAHLQLGSCLLNQESFAEAEPHLRWCFQRTPSNQGVELKLREALKGRLDGPRRAVVEGECLR